MRPSKTFYYTVHSFDYYHVTIVITIIDTDDVKHVHATLFFSLLIYRSVVCFDVVCASTSPRMVKLRVCL